MTRETKVGLVVSASFLCLLGAVFYCKLKESDRAPTQYAHGDGAAPVIPADPAPVSSGDSTAWALPAVTTQPTATVSTTPNRLDPHILQAQNIGAAQTGANGDLPPSTPVAPTDKIGEPGVAKRAPVVPEPGAKGDAKTASAGENPPHSGESPPNAGQAAPTPQTVATGPASPPAAAGSLTSGPTNPSTAKTDAQPPASASQGGPKGLPGVAPNAAPPSPAAPVNDAQLANAAGPAGPPSTTAPGGLNGSKATTAPTNTQPESPASGPAAVSAGQPGTSPGGPANTAEPAAGAARASTNPAAGPTPSSPVGDPASPGSVPASTTVPSAPAPSAPGSAANPAPQTPGADLLPPVPMPATARPENGGGTGTGIAPGRPISGAPAADDAPESNIRLGPPRSPIPPANQFAQGPSAPGMNSPFGGPASGNSIPPAGAPPKADSPPIAVPAVGGPSPYAVVTPQVDSYDEETYVCKPNDTFLSISRQYYQSEKYERALLLFNRNHPRATDAIRQDPPVVRDGQAVYIPPLRVLERQYASVIPDHIPLPPPVPPLASAAPGYPAPLAASGDRLYRVRPNGEMLWDVAQRTMGRGDRWAEIYNLNSQFNPQQPVPGGTTLRLPADASVPPSDRP
jgi:hypothetical protein